jgi:hypothetical protein
MHYATLRPDENAEDAAELARDEHSPLAVQSGQEAEDR